MRLRPPRLLRRLLLRRRLRRLLPLRRDPVFQMQLETRRMLRLLRHHLQLSVFSQVPSLHLHPPQLVEFHRLHPLLRQPPSEPETIH